MRPIIALTGFRGCGKNFYFDNVIKDWEFKENSLFPRTIKFKNFAFADILKYYCEKIYGFTYDEIEKYKRNSQTKFTVGKNKLTMREILVKTANSLRELTDDAIWAKLTIEYIENWLDKYEKGNEYIIPVITDLRFKTELEFLKSNFKPILIYIESQCEDCKKSIGNKDELEVLELKKLANNIENLPCYTEFTYEDKRWLRSQIFDQIKKLI